MGNDEFKSFMQVWISAVMCMCYCYYIASGIPKGILRLVSLLPIFCIFFVLPLGLSSLHLCGITAFFLSWLANFKLLLFAFDLGPLSSPPLPHPFTFICFACLPIKAKQDPTDQNPKSPESKTNPSNEFMPKWILLAFKVVILGVLFRVYDYREDLNKNVLLILYCLHLYLELELVLALTAMPARAVFGFEIEPQFNEPYLSTSLQDFWGRRWNLMVPGILRPTVYTPSRRFSVSVVGPRWARLVGLVAAFAVSGLMHELLYYYLMRVPPTWEVTWFFVLHGVCTAAETAVKRAAAVETGGWRLHPAVSGTLTLGFVILTGVWLFFPQLLRNGAVDKVIKEGLMIADFLKGNSQLRLAS